MAAIAAALMTVATALTEGDAIVVCFTPDFGFNMVGDAVIPSGTIVEERDVAGFDSDLRQIILTGKMRQKYVLKKMDSYGELQVYVRAGECDVGWAPFYQLAEREACDAFCADLTNASLASIANWEPYRCCSDFSTPYIDWTVAVLYRREGGSGSLFTSLFIMFTDRFFINLVSFIFVMICLFAHLMWAAERKANSEEFPPRYIDGIDDGIWWAAVTVTTVGYGDKAPKTPVGRVVGILWMLFGLAMFSVLTGHMSSQFVKLGQRNEIEKAPDLQDRTVCGYASTFDQHWLSGIRINAVVGSGVGECGEMLRKGEVDAILMDRPIMQYYKLTEEWCRTANLAISPPLASPLVGLIYPEGSKWAALRTRINAGILSFINSPEAAVYNEAYFPSGDSDELNGQLQLTIVLPAAGLILAYIILQICVCLSKRLPPDKYLRGSLSPMRGLRGCAQIEAHPTRTRGPTS